MAIRRTVAIASSIAGLFPFGPPAGAAAPGIVFTTVMAVRSSPSQWDAGVACHVVAVPGTPAQVVLAVDLTCSVNDVTRSSSAPGGTTAVTLVVVTAPAVEICADATVTYLDLDAGGSAFVATAGPRCRPLADVTVVASG